MGIKEILLGLFHGKSGKDGIWDFLGKRSADKSRVELERVRNDGTQKLIPLLKPGMVLTEGGPDWFREIRAPEPRPPGMLLTTVTYPAETPLLPADELETTTGNELEAAAGNEAETTRPPSQGPADEFC